MELLVRGRFTEPPEASPSRTGKVNRLPRRNSGRGAEYVDAGKVRWDSAHYSAGKGDDSNRDHMMALPPLIASGLSFRA
ncbi:MAG: hypothetical protein DME86_01425 [Verrucomicrobia bacterium]|nr:MAG: hypothetical protein DME86_01425 [Verrucomicrobiota bacterium]